MTGVNKQIANVYTGWLSAEVQSSGIERNKILDDYDAAIRGLKGGWNHPENFTAVKLESHLQRMEVQWLPAFNVAPDDEFMAARVIFGGLMQLSGSYRNQCYVEAVSHEDYLKRRVLGSGIDLRQPIDATLREISAEDGDFSSSCISFEDLDGSSQKVAKDALKATQAMVHRVRMGYDLGLADSISSRKMRENQYAWAGFTTSALALAAKLRDGKLENVPFLEPRSITDQSGEVYYPFRDTIDWAQVIAA